MKSLDMKNDKYKILAANLVAAAKGEDENVFEEAMIAFAKGIERNVLADAELYRDEKDIAVLASRGIRQLTGAETAYYQAVIDAMRSTNPMQALGNLDVVMPETIINDVFVDLEQSHPLLAAIDFQYGRGVTTWLLNAHESQLATWSPLCAEIVKELTSGFKAINVTQNKLSAFIPVCKAMLDLGPVWLDRYVRAILGEALALGLEDGIINGRGQTASLSEPIGMRKDLAGSVAPSTGYPDKTPVAVTSLDPAAYGELLAAMAKTENGNPRIVQNVILIVNPTDYLTKVMPATTYLTPQGTYVNNVLPHPTTVIQSVCVDEGEAIIGLGNRYLFISGTGKEGVILFSDEYRFLEDERVYLTKLYGHGQAKDNNAFMLLDISELEPLFLRVQTV